MNIGKYVLLLIDENTVFWQIQGRGLKISKNSVWEEFSSKEWIMTFIIVTAFDW